MYSIVMDFQCPICKCDLYRSVTVMRADGELYQTEFFACWGCTVMFREPELFSAAPSVKDLPYASRGPMAYELSLAHQSFLDRYWTARVKRENGGREPKPEEVSRARSRYRE